MFKYYKIIELRFKKYIFCTKSYQISIARRDEAIRRRYLICYQDGVWRRLTITEIIISFFL